MQNRITNSGRRRIIDLLVNGIRENWEEFSVHTKYDIWGCSKPKSVLEKLYPLQNIPSKAPQFSNAAEEIALIQKDDTGHYPVAWVFQDDRFQLENGSDGVLLDFLCTIFHPDVRNDNDMDAWKAILGRLNKLLEASQYVIFPKQWIGIQAVYGWRDLTQPRFLYLAETDLSCFLRLFVNSGNVVGFYKKSDFDDFTRQEVGLPLCQCYEDSKGGALRSFLNHCMDEGKVLRLLKALMKYAQNDGMQERFPDLFVQCQSILDKALGSNSAVTQMAKKPKKTI